GNVHDMRGVVDRRSDGGDLRQWPALLAEIIDDPRPCRPQIGGDSRVARLEANDPRRQLGFAKLRPVSRDDAYRPQGEQGAGMDRNRNRRDRAVAIAVRGARKRTDVGREDRKAGAVDRDSDRRVVISRSPERVEDWAEIALRAPGERVPVGWRIPA